MLPSQILIMSEERVENQLRMMGFTFPCLFHQTSITHPLGSLPIRSPRSSLHTLLLPCSHQFRFVYMLNGKHYIRLPLWYWSTALARMMWYWIIIISLPLHDLTTWAHQSPTMHLKEVLWRGFWRRLRRVLGNFWEEMGLVRVKLYIPLGFSMVYRSAGILISYVYYLYSLFAYLFLLFWVQVVVDNYNDLLLTRQASCDL